MQVMAKHHSIAGQRGLTLEPQLDPALPPVTVDVELMREVITRLLDNALNYTPRDGAVTIITATHQQVDFTWVTLTVKDTGPGILPEELPRLFDRFYRGAATRNYTIPGVGLSLPICLSIVGKLGGRITVESEPEQGASFTVWLK